MDTDDSVRCSCGSEHQTVIVSGEDAKAQKTSKIYFSEPAHGFIVVDNPAHRQTSKINMKEWLESEHIEGMTIHPAGTEEL